MAARRFSWANGTDFARPRGSALAINGRPSTGNVRGDPSLRAAGRPRRMATTNPDWRQSLGHRIWHLPVGEAAPSAGAGANTTDATGALVLRRSDRAWRRTDACAGLSRALPGRRHRQGPRGGGRAHKRQSGDGRSSLHRPLRRDVDSWRILGVASLPLPGSQVRVAELVQSGCDLGLQSRVGGCTFACGQPGQPTVSRFTLGLTVVAKRRCAVRGNCDEDALLLTLLAAARIG